MKWALVLTGVVLGTLIGSAQSQEFGGYDCTDDCSGHKAGYNWADQNGITDANDCSGNSQSFVEGCQAYTEDPYRGSDEDDDGNDIDD
jgi:hypothetical protein